MLAVRRALVAGLLVFGALLATSSPAQRVVTDINPPDAGRSAATSINSNGVAVGFAFYQPPESADTLSRAIVWRPDGSVGFLDPDYAFGPTQAYYITDSGFVVGATADGVFLWDSAKGMREVPLREAEPDELRMSWPRDVAEDGTILGTTHYFDGYTSEVRHWLYRDEALQEIDVAGLMFDPMGLTPTGAVFGYVAGGGYDCAVVWDGGSFSPFTTIGDWLCPVDMNGSGVAVLSMEASVDPVLRHADGTLVRLRLVGPDYVDASGVTRSTAFGDSAGTLIYPKGIDEVGRVYGEARVAYLDPDTGYWRDRYYVWAWRDGEAATSPVTGEARSLSFNDQGQVAGSCSNSFNTYGFVWEPFGAGITQLDGLYGYDAAPYSINDSGQIVGELESEGEFVLACRWDLVLPSVLDFSTPVVTVRNAKTVIVTVTITNPAAEAVRDVVVESATLGGVAATTGLPLSLRTIKPGASKKITLQFKRPAAGDLPLVIRGTCSAGAFYTTQTVTVK